jgi:hypothetical protein
MELITARLQKITTYLSKIKGITFVFIITSLLYLVSISCNIVLGFIKQKDLIFLNFPSKENSIVFIFITPIILAPIIETFLGQSLPYYLLKKLGYMNGRNYLVITASALFFGILHFYSLFYIIYAFLLGLVLSYGYVVRIKSDKNAFLLIAVCHALLNAGILIRNLI